MNLASEIIHNYCPFEVNEGRTHSHNPKERAQFFSTYGFDPATTEREYIELLHALVRVEKPMNILETGTGAGIATLVMAAALEENEMDGKITTIDNRFLGSLKELAKKFGIRNSTINVVQAHSCSWIQDYGTTLNDPFDFCVFDTIQSQKAEEALQLLEVRKVKPGSVLAFHDTSPQRFHEENNPDALNREYLRLLHEISQKREMQRLDFPNSRGLTLLRTGVE